MHRQISTVLTDNVEEKNNTWFAEAGVNVETQIHSYNGNFQQKAETAQIHLKEWRFGFVNMKSNLMQTDLIQSLNGLWFDSYKLRANLQRFGRQRHEQKKDICDHSNLLVAPLFRLETEIQETMLLYEQMNSFYYVDLWLNYNIKYTNSVDLWLNLEKNYSTKKAICGFVIKKIHFFFNFWTY